MVLAINKLTRWTEVEPGRKVTMLAEVKFLTGIVCCFGVPNRIITDIVKILAPRSALPPLLTPGATRK